MTDPCALDFADHAGVDDFLHFTDGFHIAHVVSDKQLGSGAVRGVQNTVAALYRDRHWFFQKNGFSRVQCGDGHFLMVLVADHDEHGIQRRVPYKFTIVGVIGAAALFRTGFMEPAEHFRAAVADGGDHGAGRIKMPGDHSCAERKVRSDQTGSNRCFHCCSPPVREFIFRFFRHSMRKLCAFP